MRRKQWNEVQGGKKDVNVHMYLHSCRYNLYVHSFHLLKKLHWYKELELVDSVANRM